MNIILKTECAMLWTAVLVGLAAVGIVQVNCHALSGCIGAECFEGNLRELESANFKLRVAMGKFDTALKNQEQEIKDLKKFEQESQNNGSEYALELYGKLNPCSRSPESANIIESVAQLEGLIYFTCYGLNHSIVYDGQTLQHLRNIHLPLSDLSGISRYIVANPMERSLYLVAGSHFRDTLDNGVTTDEDTVWKAMITDHKWTRIVLPTHFSVSLIGPAVDGKMMIGNSSHIQFYDYLGSISKSVKYLLPLSSRLSASRRIVQTSKGSILIPAFRIIQLDTNWRYIPAPAGGLDFPEGGKDESYINDISLGPKGTVLASDITKNRIVILDGSVDKFQELKGDVTKPYRLSYDVNHSRLVVLEWTDDRSVGAKMFYIVPAP